MSFEEMAAEARRRVEAEATRIEQMRTAYIMVGGAERFAITVGNGHVKPEGENVIGMVPTADAASLIDPFVKCCLSLRDKGRTLVWRRLPAMEEEDGKVKLIARLLWLGDDEMPDPDGWGFI